MNTHPVQLPHLQSIKDAPLFSVLSRINHTNPSKHHATRIASTKSVNDASVSDKKDVHQVKQLSIKVQQQKTNQEGREPSIREKKSHPGEEILRII